MEKGWIKLHRRILENHFLMHDDKAFMVFTKLLMLVGKEKGEWAGGRRQLAKIMHMNDSTLYKVLLRLEGEGIVTLENKIRYSVVSISNWKIYQEPGKPQKQAFQQPIESEKVTETRTLVQQRSMTHTVTDSVTIQEAFGNHTVTAQGHSNKKKKEKNTISDADLLKLLNEKTGRNFRTLPTGYKKTIDLFSLEEISTAFDNMLHNEWHKKRIHELRSEYLLRASTVDTFLNQTTAPSDADWFSRIKEASN